MMSNLVLLRSKLSKGGEKILQAVLPLKTFACRQENIFPCLPDGIPAIFFINTREYTKVPLAIILRKSLDEWTLPDVFKLAYVTPLYKGV